MPGTSVVLFVACNGESGYTGVEESCTDVEPASPDVSAGTIVDDADADELSAKVCK